MFSALDDHEVDSLLAGRPPADPELAPLAEVVSLLRRSAASEPAPAMDPSLRAQLAGPPVVALAVRRAGRSALLKAGAAAAAAAVVALGVGASQNRLPAGLQDVLSSTANLVGIQVPSADERPSRSSGGGADDTGPSTNDSDPGHEGTTPGGATPADPGEPGDKEPATPATPPQQSGATPGENNGTTPDLPPPAPAATPPPAAAEDPTAPPPEDTSTPVVEPAPEPLVEPEDPGNGPPNGTVTGSSRGNPSEAGELNGTGGPGGPADPAASAGPAGPGAGQASAAGSAPTDPA